MLWSEGGSRLLSLTQLWGALAALFAVQIGVGAARIASGTGPWAVPKLGNQQATKAGDVAGEEPKVS